MVKSKLLEKLFKKKHILDTQEEIINEKENYDYVSDQKIAEELKELSNLEIHPNSKSVKSHGKINTESNNSVNVNFTKVRETKVKHLDKQVFQGPIYDKLDDYDYTKNVVTKSSKHIQSNDVKIYKSEIYDRKQYFSSKTYSKVKEFRHKNINDKSNKKVITKVKEIERPNYLNCNQVDVLDKSNPTQNTIKLLNNSNNVKIEKVNKYNFLNNSVKMGELFNRNKRQLFVKEDEIMSIKRPKIMTDRFDGKPKEVPIQNDHENNKIIDENSFENNLAESNSVIESVENEISLNKNNITEFKVLSTKKIKISITQECLDGLQPKTWMTFASILKYGRIICDTLPNKAAIIPGYLFTDPKRRIIDKTELCSIISHYKFCFSPIINNKHFSLIFVNNHAKTFCLIDSLPISEKNNSKVFFKIWLKRLDKIKSLINCDGFKYIKIKHSYQKDKYSCGVFVCEFMRRLLNDEYLEFDVDEKHMNDIRHSITQILMPYLVPN